ncbi:hypothetical protein [Synechocystis sp. LEGE 06083]|uniref:hypothetical protein n=1 Tax=Synechocystis sp. LEGE 06083 TaxID=915336 RepID=UPI001D14D0C3|nr:hypothetical protein [Synechocystis sp. LEGE 06083]
MEPVLPESREEQLASFLSLVNNLGTATSEDIQLALDSRETVTPEEELTPEITAKFQQKIRANS